MEAGLVKAQKPSRWPATPAGRQSDLQATVSEEPFGHAGLSKRHCEGVKGDVRDGHLCRADGRPPRHLANDIISHVVVTSGDFRRGDLLVCFAGRVPLGSCVRR